MIDLKTATLAEWQRTSLKEILPYVVQRIIEEEILPMQDAQNALAHLMVMEQTELNTIDNGAVCEACPDFRDGAVNALEVIRAAKRKMADRLRLTSHQREKLSI